MLDIILTPMSRKLCRKIKLISHLLNIINSNVFGDTKTQPISICLHIKYINNQLTPYLYKIQAHNNKSTHRGNQAKLNLLTTKLTNKRVVIVIRVLNS